MYFSRKKFGGNTLTMLVLGSEDAFANVQETQSKCNEDLGLRTALHLDFADQQRRRQQQKNLHESIENGVCHPSWPLLTTGTLASLQIILAPAIH